MISIDYFFLLTMKLGPLTSGGLKKAAYRAGILNLADPAREGLNLRCPMEPHPVLRCNFSIIIKEIDTKCSPFY